MFQRIRTRWRTESHLVCLGLLSYDSILTARAVSRVRIAVHEQQTQQTRTKWNKKTNSVRASIHWSMWIIASVHCNHLHDIFFNSSSPILSCGADVTFALCLVDVTVLMINDSLVVGGLKLVQLISGLTSSLVEQLWIDSSVSKTVSTAKFDSGRFTNSSKDDLIWFDMIFVPDRG